MNIRTASLDPNAPRAPKDCRVCNRRRIKCDRSLPSCKKCEIRKLACTGYDRQLKWTQGVVSKANYASQAASIPRKLSKCKEDKTSSPNSSISTPKSGYTAVSPGPTDYSLSATPSVSCTSKEIDVVQNNDGHYGVDLSLSWSHLPHIYQDPNVRLLINHYDYHVAGTCVWIDSPENRWRNDVLPLAQESPSLLAAVLALSSIHLSSKLPASEPSSVQLSTLSIRYRDQSLRLLAQQLEKETHNPFSSKSTPKILVTMLILCYLEMVHSDSAIWRVHMQACHIMIRRWLSTASPIDRLDTASRFIITELSILNVFASTSSFGDIEEITSIDPAEGEPTIFSDFLETIHCITIEERKMTRPRQLPCVNLKLFTTKLENSCQVTRRLSRQIYFSTEQLKRDFDRLVDIYYYSGLIYAYQAFAEPSEAALYIPRVLGNLLRDLALIPTGGGFAQNLAWPLFIAGTACRHLGEEQRLLERLLQETMKATGFSNCQEALKFLRVFWSEEGVEGENWIGFARGYAKQGREFLIF